MHPRLAEEWDEIVAIWPAARHRVGPERVEIPLEFEDRRYNQASTEIAILVPPGYRATGPDGFLVPQGLAFADGGALPSSDAASLGMPGWLLVSFHFIDPKGSSTWHPTADPARGDNFSGYLNAVESFLARGCD
jgi:hypothetical protein